MIAAHTGLSQVATKADMQELNPEWAQLQGRLASLYWLIGTLGVVLSSLQGRPGRAPLFG